MKCRWCGKVITKEESDKFEGNCGVSHMEAGWQVEHFDYAFLKKRENKDEVKK